jgi:hypothetical protein
MAILPSSTRKWILAACLSLAVAPLWAAPGGGDAIVLVADSRGMAGWQAWWTNLYNESRLYFTVFTIVLIPALGVVLGSLTDLALAQIGINLKSRVLAEH